MKAIPGLHPSGSQRLSNFVPDKIVYRQKVTKKLYPYNDENMFTEIVFPLRLINGTSCTGDDQRHIPVAH